MIGYRNKSVILAGDFNVDLLNENQSSEISNFLYSTNFSPLISIPTRITENTAKCLDQIWYNFERASFSGSIISDTTDHYPVFVVSNSLNGNEKITTTFRCHSDVNINNLVAGVRDMTYEYFAMCDRMTLDRRTEWFLDNLWSLYNRHCHKKLGPTYSKLSDMRGLICEKFNFRKLGVSATEIAILKEN